MPFTVQSYRLSLAEVALSNSQQSDAVRTFSGIANSGKPFSYKGHRAIVDLADIQHKSTIPALIEHDRSRRAGVAQLSVSDDGLIISGHLLSNQHGKEIAADADEQFPWQLSAHIVPGKTEHLKPGQTAVVNGHTVTGPIMILRQNTVREVSFTPTGVDDKTTAVVLSDDGQSPQQNQPEYSMTLEEAIAEITKLKARIDALEKEKEGVEKERDQLKADEHKATIEAKLSEAGFKRDKDGKWQGISEKTLGILLSANSDDAVAIIADLKPAESVAIPQALLSEQYPPSTADSIKLSENPIVADAEKRAKAENHYI